MPRIRILYDILEFKEYMPDLKIEAREEGENLEDAIFEVGQDIFLQIECIGSLEISDSATEEKLLELMKETCMLTFVEN